MTVVDTSSGCVGPMSWGNGHGRLDRYFVNCSCGFTVENLSTPEAMDDVVAWHKGRPSIDEMVQVGWVDPSEPGVPILRPMDPPGVVGAHRLGAPRWQPVFRLRRKQASGGLEDTPSEWWDHATEPARAFVHGQKRAMVLDLWTASGRDPLTFEPFCGEHGWPLVWSLLLHEVRGIKPPCMEPTGPDDFCVFDDGHFGPHYGADDVATPVFLPKRRTRSAA